MKSLRKKPWNRTNQPVYSISSLSNGRENMNICTYVTAVSMQPKRFIVAIYKNTLTLELINNQLEFVLQLLSQQQYKVVKLLGKTSGYTVNKINKLREPVLTYQNFTILSNSLSVIHLKVIEWLDGGDHVCALCDVLSYKNLNEGEPLTLDFLREKKIISA